MNNKYWHVSSILKTRRFENLRMVFKYFSQDEEIFEVFVKNFNKFFLVLKKSNIEKRLSSECVEKLVHIQKYLKWVIGKINFNSRCVLQF